MARLVLNPRASAESLHSIHSLLSTTSVVPKEVGPASSPLQSCAASSSHFLFSQGSSVLCVKHDTLELDRRFERHSNDVTLIQVDNSSETGYGRVVSIDSSKEAIVWDFRDGDELHRFSPFEEIRVAAWMRNGNLSLGDCKGNVVVFNPAQGDSILSRTVSNPICALAPSADCTTFALGYNNGSILIATLTPFTILYTLTTSSLSPSPITSLAWHTSSSRQKSDMLATQTRDGDLRVWSVAKTIESGEPAKVVRILSMEGGNKKGNNWCTWSMKGRVVQYSEGETTVWDVRNRKVFSETVDTPVNLSGIAVYGLKGNLFTITKDHTVQQYGLYPPAVTATVQHLPTVPPPSPPSSIEEKKNQSQEESGHQIERLNPRDHDYNVATMSPLGRIAHELELLEKMEAQGLGISSLGPHSMQRTVSASSKISLSSVSRRPSIASTMSATSVNSETRSISDQRSTIDMGEYDMNTPLARNRLNSLTGRGSLDHGQHSPSRRPHPLAQEIIASPIDRMPPRTMLDLFGNISARLPFVINDSPPVPSSGKKDEDGLRREMLYTIFGWKGDVDSLIRDELDSVDSRSLTAVMLRMWLGELDQNSLSVLLGSDFMVSADWLFLALSAMDGKKAWDTVARAMVMRLAQKGDIHTAAVVLLALGAAKDAVDIYVTHNMHM
ncbi:WD40-repeat-containing domain protein [Tirmania nivea]|nr:WD40-repeat-containing domain protein [Tirmania nivea]